MDDDQDIEDVLAERRAANPRRSPDRIPVGAEHMPRLVILTVAALVVATIVLVAVLVVGRA